MKSLSQEVRRVIKCCMWALIQFGDRQQVRTHQDDDGKYDSFIITHACMSAGEDLCEMLEDYGLAFDDGWDLVLTNAGLEMLNED